MARGKAQQAGMDFEKRFAELTGGKIQPGSGNQWFAKLDVGVALMLWELKHTGKESFSLNRAVLSKAIRQASGMGSAGAIPALAIDICGESFSVMKLEDQIRLFEEDAKIFTRTKASEKRARAGVPLILRNQDDD